jgi:D-beta-D-heptose 7-phosphate kinase / D-beta-D-heptose 1-phosphate adenosyltransferase
MLDYYLWGNCERISPEAPVQVVDILKDSTILGGAGNVIQNLLAFGARVDIASVIGTDDPGDELIRMLQNIGAGVGLLVRQPQRKTSKKTRIVAANQQVVRYDVESKEAVSEESENRLAALIDTTIGAYDVVLISDYGKGVLTTGLTQHVIRKAKAAGVKVLIDPKGVDYSKYVGAYLITPNKKEAGMATKAVIKDKESLEEAGFKLKKELGLEYAIVTLSEDGIALFADQMHLIPTKVRDVFDVTGAGDTVLASLGFALANGLDIVDACHFANYAAGVVVGKVGSATATLDEIEEYVDSFLKASSHLYIRSSASISQIATRLRQNGKRIVFAEGFFDSLQPWQIRALETAKSYGDVLIVGVRSDEAAARGGLRATNPETERAYLLSGLKVVDYVIIFSEGDSYTLLHNLKPAVCLMENSFSFPESSLEASVPEVKILSWADLHAQISPPVNFHL